jgi:hypothetical protein
MSFYRSVKLKILMILCLIALGLILTSCSGDTEDEMEEVILARVGDVTISLAEFMRRSEMTVRPPYASGDNNLHKKIIINSLIAEKMLALEAGEKNELAQSRQFKLYIQGRREQAMREWLLHKEGFEKVQISNSEIQKVYDVAGRTYKVQYYTIPDSNIAATIRDKLKTEKGLFEIFHKQLWPDEEIAEREIEWKKQEHPLIHESLFSDKPDKNSVVGPLKIGENDYIIMKVLGWTDQKVLSDQGRKERRDLVKEKLTQEKAFEIYDKFVLSIMDGKKLDFDRETFNKLIEIVGPLYIRTPQEKKELFLSATFNENSKNPEIKRLEDGLNGILDNSLLSFEGQVWTVRQFKEEIQKHPLVFRKNLPESTKFAEHFRLAIVDMIRDKYLTEEAYKRGYDKVNVVKRYTNMWKDALLAQYQKERYLIETVPNLSDSIQTAVMLEKYMNPYIDQLQDKYGNSIRVNVEQFNKIKLTHIDMLVMQTNVPFPIMVPSFPQITTDPWLDYGKKME